MKNLLILLIFPFLISCETMTAVSSVVGSSVACNRSEKEVAFPKKGSQKSIELSFNLKDGDEPVQFLGNAVCQYQGSICGGGKWFSVWYGDQSITHSIRTPSGDELVFQPHNFCTRIWQYEEACASGECDSLKVFKFLFKFSEARKKEHPITTESSAEIRYQDRALITAYDLEEYGYTIEYFQINISDENL